MLAPPELARRASARQVAGHHRRRRDGRRVGRDRRVPGRALRQRPARSRRPARPNACATRYWLHYAEGSAMPPLLLEARVRSRRERRRCRSSCGRSRARSPAGRRARSSSRRSSCTSTTSRASSARSTWFAGNEMHRRRRPDELSDRGRRRARRARRVGRPKLAAFLAAHPRATCVPAGAREGRALRADALTAARSRPAVDGSQAMSVEVTDTAAAVARVRSWESQLPEEQRLFEDPYAHLFARRRRPRTKSCSSSSRRRSSASTSGSARASSTTPSAPRSPPASPRSSTSGRLRLPDAAPAWEIAEHDAQVFEVDFARAARAQGAPSSAAGIAHTAVRAPHRGGFHGRLRGGAHRRSRSPPAST